MRRFARLAGFVALILAGATAPSTATAEGWVPERRLLVAEDTDLPGNDLEMIFDTTRAACDRACLTDPACAALTYNTRTRACFPKSAAGAPVPFAGAISARVQATDPAVLAAAPARAEALDFLPPADLAAARTQAQGLGVAHPAGLLPAEAHLASGNIAAALALSDAPDLWVAHGRRLLDTPEHDWTRQREAHEAALAAAINGWLRAAAAPDRAAAAVLMAAALEPLERGRDMIAALRLAQAQAPSPAIAAQLETAIARHGFRIVGHEVENTPALPRICAEFSEDLAPGTDFAPFVQRIAPGTAVEAEGRALCVTGLNHGQRYSLTFRAGLPAASGESLARPVTLDLYVRDRPALVRFPGRGYVLPAGGPLALPVETVNTATLDLTLRRVSDRNLVRAMRDGVFARPLSAWQEEDFADTMTEDVWQGTAEVEGEVNRDITSRLPLAEVAGDLGAGIYVLRAAVPGADPWTTPAAQQWFVVSDLGLTTLWGVDGLHVMVRGLRDAGPKPGAEVRLVSRGNRVLATATADDEGQAVFAAGLTRGTGNAAPALVTVADGDADFAFLLLSEPEFDLSDRGVAGREAAPPVDVFVTTDRGAYRAGETVHVTALARDPALEALEGLPLTLRLRRPDGLEHTRRQTDPAGAGGHAASLPIPGSAPRGLWRLDVLADPQAPPLASRSFLVEDFLPERLDLDLTLPDGPLAADSAPVIQVVARYLFGADAADLSLEGEIALRAAYTLDGFPGFRFGRHDAAPRTLFEPLPDGVRTGPDGRARVTAALPDLPDPGRPLEMVATLRVSEGSGRPVERSITRALVPATPLPGLRPLFDGAVPEGAEARFQVVVAGPGGTAVPARLRWVLNRVETRFQWYQMWGEWNWEPLTRRSRLAEGVLELGAGPAELSLPVGMGRHELVVERVDGPPAPVSIGFDAGWYAAAGAGVETPDMLELALDSRTHAPGDTARLRIVPRAPGVALVTVLSNRVIDWKLVPVEAGETVITLPVTEAWGAGAYVVASVLHPTDGSRARGPARSLGLAHAAVDPGPRRLAVALDVPDQASPRGVLPATLRIDGLAPGETAHATVAAVDVGILNLTGFAAPDPEGHYFGQRRLGVALRDLYGRLIDPTEGAMGRVRSGGDSGLAPGLQAPPPTEELVAWFSGPVTVGPDGLAELSVPLPAFDGTVRLMAVAWSARGVGQASADVLVRDPVVVQSSLPRFLSPGDDSRLRLELTHASGPAGAVALSLEASPGLRLGAIPAEVTLQTGGRTALIVPVMALTPGLQRIAVTLTPPGGAALTRTLSLPVARNDPPVARTSRFTLDPGQGFTLDRDAFAGLRTGTARATLTLGPLAGLDAAGLLAWLDAFPHGCTEQVAAAAMPLLYLADTARTLGLGAPAELEARIDAAVRQVLLNQSSGGGFGLWAPGSGDLWLDAFVTDFLSRARARGHAVPEPAFRAALDNLRNQLAYAPDFDADGAPWAYALMVLAREGAAAIGDLRYYADVRAAAFDTPMAAAQLATALAAHGESTRADALFSRAVRLLPGSAAEGAVWRADYGSHARDAAALLTLAVEAGSMAVDRDALAADLARHTPAHPSTQEALWRLLAAHSLAMTPPAGITLDGAPLTGPPVRSVADTDPPLRLENTGAAPVTVTLTTTGAPAEPEPAAGTGYRLERRYMTLEGAPADPATVAAGTRMITLLEVTPLENRQGRLILDDPLPAGFEIDNPNLLRGGDIAALEGLDLLATPETAEFRAERFVAAVDWAGTGRFRLGYIVRAVSPGSYHHPAASLEDMYRPTLRARTDAGRVTVTE